MGPALPRDAMAVPVLSKVFRIDAEVGQHGGQQPFADFLAAILQRGAALAKLNGAVAALAETVRTLQKLNPIHAPQYRTNMCDYQLSSLCILTDNWVVSQPPRSQDQMSFLIFPRGAASTIMILY